MENDLFAQFKGLSDKLDTFLNTQNVKLPGITDPKNMPLNPTVSNAATTTTSKPTGGVVATFNQPAGQPVFGEQQNADVNTDNMFNTPGLTLGTQPQQQDTTDNNLPETDLPKTDLTPVGDQSQQDEGLPQGQFYTPSGAIVDENGNLIEEPPESPVTKEIGQSPLEDYGIFGDFRSLRLDDIVMQLGKAFGIDDITTTLRNSSQEYNKEVQEINDNPWISAGTKRERLTKAQDRFNKTRDSLMDEYKLKGDLIGTAINVYQGEKKLAQDMLFKQLDVRQKSLDSQRQANLDAQKLSDTKFSQNLDLAKLALNRRELTLKEQEKLQEKGDSATDSLEGLEIVNAILDSGDLSAVSGKLTALPGFRLGSADTRAKLLQLKGLITLDNRKKLKGQGAISDFEFKVLSDSSSALPLDEKGVIQLTEADAERELRRIRGVFTTAAGLNANVKVTSPTGRTEIMELGTDEITDFIRNGYKVEY